MPDSYLFVDDHTPAHPAYPVIDAHNHLWANWDAIDRVVQVMDEAGVVAYCDLTANISIAWGGGGYLLGQGSFADFLRNTVQRHPGRFYGFTTSLFAQDASRPLFTDHRAFVDEAIALLEEHVRLGARGLKILKEFGMQYRDGEGRLIPCDDPRLAPIWEACARLGVPVLIHQSDPYGFFQPVTPANEHYDSLQKYPAWSFADPKFPRKEVLLAQRDNLVRRHPRTTFLLPHAANFAENLRDVARVLDAFPNAYIDFSARCDELGRQPWTAREFLIRYQDRVYFGTDMPASLPMYRFHWRFLETRDEWIMPPDYDGTFGRHRWRVTGLHLPRRVLRKLYYQNALRLIPHLRQQLRG
jgi:predicted TIM-barrel fold metal-dependent hydrolase